MTVLQAVIVGALAVVAIVAGGLMITGITDILVKRKERLGKK